MTKQQYVHPHTGALVGASIPRIEDKAFLKGSAKFIEDFLLPRMSHVEFVRSVYPKALIQSVDVTSAFAVDGVLAVFTGKDLAKDDIGGIPWEIMPSMDKTTGNSRVELGDPSVARSQPAMAESEVCYVGQIVAMVVARTKAAALLGAERVLIDYKSLPAVMNVESAVLPNAPVVDPAFKDNVCFRLSVGEKKRTASVFNNAEYVTRIRHVQNRGAGVPIETRGYLGDWSEQEQKFSLYASAGKPHPVRNTLAKYCFFCEPEDIRVIAPRIGGGFGAKNVVYPEQVLILWASRKIKRPVRWIQGRSESFLSDVHTRDLVSSAEFAFDSHHRIIAMRVLNLGNLGAYLGPRAVNPIRNSIKIAPSVYDIPVGYLEALGVFTNTVPTCPIRGAGEPEGQFTPERLLDVAAVKNGIDRFEIRRRNLISSSSLPYRTITGLEYDCGRFDKNFERAIELSDRAGYLARKRSSKHRGMLRGFALCNTIEALGFGLDEEADIRCFKSGHAELRIGSMSNGQGHETIYGQIIAGMLGIPIEKVRVIQGDTDDIAYGTGTGACRSIIVGGSAVLMTTNRLIEKGKRVAAELLEVAVEDLHFLDGKYIIFGTDRSIKWEEVLVQANGLSDRDRFMPKNFTFPNGAHACEVEVDPETGRVTLDRYVMVHDCGTPVNPVLVEAQLVGGVVHGLGQAFSEHIVYDEISGQLISGSFLDYGLRRAADLPTEGFVCELNPVPTGSNPLGAKSVGEAGVAIAPVVAVNAVVDAISVYGVWDISMPMTPAKVLETINSAACRFA